MKSVTAFGRGAFCIISDSTLSRIDRIKFLHSLHLEMFFGRPLVWAIGHRKTRKGPEPFAVRSGCTFIITGAGLPEDALADRRRAGD